MDGIEAGWKSLGCNKESACAFLDKISKLKAVAGGCCQQMAMVIYNRVVQKAVTGGRRFF